MRAHVAARSSHAVSDDFSDSALETLARFRSNFCAVRRHLPAHLISRGILAAAYGFGVVRVGKLATEVRQPVDFGPSDG